MIEYKDSQIAQIIAELEPDFDKYRKDIQDFKKRYSQLSASEISWIKFCTDATELGCCKFAFYFFTALLNRRLYTGDYSETLYDMLPTFKECQNKPINSNVRHLLCGNRITELIVYKNENRFNGHFGYTFYKGHNAYLRKELICFLEDARRHNRWHSHAIIEAFEKSLGEFADKIQNHTDFTDNTFWTQIHYYKDLSADSSGLYNDGITAVIFFYRWLVNRYPDHVFFSHSFTMTKTLLFSSKLKSMIKNNCYFCTYSPHADLKDHKHLCMILRNMDHLSTKLTPEGYIEINLSAVGDSLYRKIVLRFLQSSSSISVLSSAGHVGYISDAMKFITDLKNTDNYPNPDLYHFTTQEAILIRNYCRCEPKKLSTLNNQIGCIRRFLQWAELNSIFSFENTFFDYLRQFEEPSHTNGSSIPDEDIAKLARYIALDTKANPRAAVAQAVFHLALQTEFRISQICHLTTDCLRPSMKPGEYVIHTSGKTSHGVKNDYVITEMTLKILQDTIDLTEPYREQCSVDALKNYIFLIPGHNNGRILLFDSTLFRDYLQKACKALDLQKIYNASNLRDTHMTKALEHIIRNGKSDLEMGLLSKHKHLDTTKNHYVELELEKMLEATYGITIGTKLIDAKSKIVNSIPADLDTLETDVEHGCGKCTAKECLVTSALPCLVCKHFITTIQHEKFFIQAIENTDRMISSSKTRHDIDDLVVIKQIYCAYLEAIYKIKEMIA